MQGFLIAYSFTSSCAIQEHFLEYFSRLFLEKKKSEEKVENSNAAKRTKTFFFFFLLFSHCQCTLSKVTNMFLCLHAMTSPHMCNIFISAIKNLQILCTRSAYWLIRMEVIFTAIWLETKSSFRLFEAFYYKKTRGVVHISEWIAWIACSYISFRLSWNNVARSNHTDRHVLRKTWRMEGGD